ncbi:hypothetical protein C0J52_15222 [Blattella germanica]|nr:hypothetical protein C0J52_15222 [Blattella germanica]
MQGNPNNYSGGVAVSAVPSMVKNDPTSTSSNVCKLIAPQVKPQQQAVMSGPSPIGHPGPLSPPPFNSSNAQPGHINYQPPLGGTAAQFSSISAIPSPPTVLYNSSQQIPTQGGLYGAFQIDGTQVNIFKDFPILILPIIGPQGPFGQSQQLSNNPSTVLISSTSNSLMSASVKPSTQQIGAIGTKGGGPYQQSALPSAPQPSQNYLSSSQMVQRPGPVQSNVVPTITPSSSFYSGSAANTCQNPVVVSDVLRGLIPGGQTGFYQPTNSTLQAVQQPAPSAQQLHQTGSPYNLQAYGSQSGTATPVGLQNFGSQMAQQYRNTGLPGPTFLKSSGQHPSDHNAASNGRTQLKSPSSNHSSNQTDVGSMFTEKNGDFYTYFHILPFQQNVRGQMNLARGGIPSTPRYPQPIQRPVAYQQGGGSQGSNIIGGSGRHRPQPNSSHAPPSRPPPNINKMQTNQSGGQPYYGAHGTNMKLESNSEGKPESSPHTNNENKMPENSNASSATSSSGSSTNTKPAAANNTQQADIKMSSENNKEENSTPPTE